VSFSEPQQLSVGIVKIVRIITDLNGATEITASHAIRASSRACPLLQGSSKPAEKLVIYAFVLEKMSVGVNAIYKQSDTWTGHRHGCICNATQNHAVF
jgi:hypothetical protein